MSGGHWEYRSEKLRDQGRELMALFELLAAIEHELDWGICGDTCLGCAEKRLGPALRAFFDGNYSAAVAIMRDVQQNRCLRCESRR